MDTNTHFLIVWDCDADKTAARLRGELPSTAKVTPFVFSRREENAIARSGIENNYDEEILEPFVINRVANDGTVLGREFPNNRKTDFSEHVMQHGTPQYFNHFQDLHDIVSGILGQPGEPPC